MQKSLILLSLFSLILSGCGPSEADLDAAVDRYFKKKEDQKKLIAEVIKEMGGAPSGGNRPAPPPQPSVAEMIKNPVKVDAGKAPFKGAKNAKIEIIAFSDFQCPFCSRANPTLDQLMNDYKGKIKLVFKHRILPFHKQAKSAAIAAMAAHRQGKFWEMHDKIFADARNLNEANYKKWAKEIGLNMSKFEKDYADSNLAAYVDTDDKEAVRLGANGTPTFFINGVKLVGAQPAQRFKAIIDELL